MREFIVVRVHPSRRCSNCAHVDSSNDRQCLQLVSMANGYPMPAAFACDEHQTRLEYLIAVHQTTWPVLGIA